MHLYPGLTRILKLYLLSTGGDTSRFVVIKNNITIRVFIYSGLSRSQSEKLKTVPMINKDYKEKMFELFFKTFIYGRRS